MPSLFPTGYQQHTVSADDIESKPKKVGYKQSLMYDINEGCVKRDGQNRVLTASGIEAWKQWCYNCLNTERYSCNAYPTDFGIEKEKAMQAETKELREVMLTVDITEALMADPYQRTLSVPSIEFNWFAPDSCEIEVIVQGIDDAEIDIILTI